MTPKEFCYWLRGYFELSELQTQDERGRDRVKKPVDYLSAHHVEMIKRNLETVFNEQPAVDMGEL